MRTNTYFRIRAFIAMIALAIVTTFAVQMAHATTLGDPEVSDWPEPFDPIDPVDPPVEPEEPVVPAVKPVFNFGDGDASAPYIEQHWTGTCERRADGKIYAHTAFGRNQEIAHAQCKAKVLSEEAEG